MGLLAAFVQDGPKPTGEVNPVCWLLMTAIVAGAGIALKYIRDENKEIKADLKEERAGRLEDREKFEAQTNVLVNTILSKKKGESP